jgi:phage terminase small subunit
MKLTGKQRKFREEYLIDLNATKAGERAGYSQKTARSQAQRLLTKVDKC